MLEDVQGLDHPVCYFSCKFNKNQLNYSTIEKETMGLLLALQHLQVYLQSSILPIVVHTDRFPFTYIQPQPGPHVTGSADADIQHKKGTKIFWPMTFSGCMILVFVFHKLKNAKI